MKKDLPFPITFFLKVLLALVALPCAWAALGDSCRGANAELVGGTCQPVGDCGAGGGECALLILGIDSIFFLSSFHLLFHFLSLSLEKKGELPFLSLSFFLLPSPSDLFFHIHIKHIQFFF